MRVQTIAEEDKAGTDSLPDTPSVVEKTSALYVLDYNLEFYIHKVCTYIESLVMMGQIS